jgi:hypothetical protein
LAPGVLQFLRQQAGYGVGRTTRGKRNDQLDGLTRKIRLSQRRGKQRDAQSEDGGKVFDPAQETTPFREIWNEVSFECTTFVCKMKHHFENQGIRTP